MSRQSHLSVVRPESLPPPLVPAEAELTGVPKALIDIDWLWRSRFRRKATADEMIAAATLLATARLEKPAGSLPDDDEELAYLAGIVGPIGEWHAVKAAAMTGWKLCSDGRWYHDEVAKDVLHLWIVRLVDRRRSAAGVAKRRKKLFDPSDVDRDIAAAVAALGNLDPYAPILRNYRSDQPDIDAAAPGPTPSKTPCPTKGSEAKRRDPDSSSELRSEDSGIPDGAGKEAVDGEILPPARKDIRPETGHPESWPPDAAVRLKAVYPKWKNPGDVEKALAMLRKGGKASFSAILAGAEAVRDSVRDGTKQLQFVAHPARWLRARGWEDEPDPPPTGPPDPAPNRPTRGGLSAAYGAMRVLHLRSERP